MWIFYLPCLIRNEEKELPLNLLTCLDIFIVFKSVTAMTNVSEMMVHILVIS